MSDIEMTRGDTRIWKIAVTDPDTGAVVDLTGRTLAFMAKRQPADADGAATISKAIGAGIVVTNAAQGLAELTLLPQDTNTLPNRDLWLYWDLQMIAGGDVFTLNSGRLKVTSEIRRGAP